MTRVHVLLMQFMREHLSLLNAIPLLMLSSSYGCLQLQTELVSV